MQNRFVELGEADAGFVYWSDASRAARLLRLDLPLRNNPLAEYPMAVLLPSPHTALAQAFVDFVLGDDGQLILESYGFLPATD